MFEQQLKKTKQQLCEELFHSGHSRSQEQASIRVFAASVDDNLNDIVDSLSLLLEGHEQGSYVCLDTFVRIGLSRVRDVRKSLDKLHPDDDYKSKYDHASAEVRAKVEELMNRS